MKPLLITMEGPDTSGKSTQSILLKERLEKDGLKVIVMHFPMYETPVGEFIGKLLHNKEEKSKVSDEAFQMLYVADQLSFQDELMRLHDDYDVIILDRYFVSSLVYGLAGKEFDSFARKFEFYKKMRQWQNSLIVPDITFLYDMNPTTVAKRKDILDLHESNFKFMSKICDIYKYEIGELIRIGDGFSTYHVDAESDVNSIHEKIYAEVRRVWEI